MADNNKLPEVESEYEIPLTPDQLRDLGRFTAICSQIDFLMGEAISLITKTPWWAMTAMLGQRSNRPAPCCSSQDWKRHHRSQDQEAIQIGRRGVELAY